MFDFDLTKSKPKGRHLNLSEILEISLVDSPANPHATVSIFKRDTTGLGHGKMPDDIAPRGKQKPKIPDHTGKAPDVGTDLNVEFNGKELAMLNTLVDRLGDMLRAAEPTHGPDAAQALARDELQASIEADRGRLAEREDALAEMESLARSQQARSNRLVNQGVAQVDQIQAHRDAEEQARQDLMDNVATRNNADMLNRMMELAVGKIF